MSIDIDTNSCFEFNFSNVDIEGQWDFKHEIGQRFLSWYSYSPTTLLTRFEMGENGFTAEVIGEVRPEKIAHIFGMGQINMKILQVTRSVFEEQIKIIDGEIVEYVAGSGGSIDIDARFYDDIDFKQIWEEKAYNDMLLCDDILQDDTRDKFYS